MEITCNICKEEFELIMDSLKKEEIKIEETKEVITREYLICPVCGEQYTFAITDSKQREKLRQLLILNAEHKKSIDKTANIWERIKSKKKDIGAREEMLLRKWSGKDKETANICQTKED